MPSSSPVPSPAGTTWSDSVRPWLTADAPAVVHHGDTWTGRELATRAEAASRWLDTVGAPRGRPVAALVSSSAPALALTLAGMASARPLAPLGTRLTPPELRAVLADLAATVIVADAGLTALAEAAADGLGLRVHALPDLDPAARPVDRSGSSAGRPRSPTGPGSAPTCWPSARAPAT